MALHIASWRGHVAVVHLLLSSGASVDVKDVGRARSVPAMGRFFRGGDAAGDM